jgi:autophagy-related protein 13
MHQHPRSPATATPTGRPQAISTRTEGSRDQDAESSQLASNTGLDKARGLGIDAGTEASEQEQKATPAKEAISKLNQIISVSLSMFHLLLDSRMANA